MPPSLTPEKRYVTFYPATKDPHCEGKSAHPCREEKGSGIKEGRLGGGHRQQLQVPRDPSTINPEKKMFSRKVTAPIQKEEDYAETKLARELDLSGIKAEIPGDSSVTSPGKEHGSLF